MLPELTDDYMSAFKSALDLSGTSAAPVSARERSKPTWPGSNAAPAPASARGKLPALASTPAPAAAKSGAGLGFNMSHVVAAAQGAKAAKDATAQHQQQQRDAEQAGGAESSVLSALGGGRKLGGFGAKLLWRKAALQIKIDCSTKKPKLVDQAPDWWRVPERSRVAADAFDRQYRTNVARAEKLYHHLQHHHTTSSLEAEGAEGTPFGAAIMDVNQLRFVPPERQPQPPLVGRGKGRYRRAPLPSGGLSGQPPPAAEKNEFEVMRSIWAPRAKWSDSKSVYDADDVLAQRFTNDWNRALELGIVSMVRSSAARGAHSSQCIQCTAPH